MNIVKHDNQRAVIHLSKHGGAFLARAILFIKHFNGAYIPQVVGVQYLTAEQVADLRLKAPSLKNFNILLIDTSEISDAAPVVYSPNLFGLTIYIPTHVQSQTFTYIPSPYISRIQAQTAFFSTQKTRGPNYVK